MEDYHKQILMEFQNQVYHLSQFHHPIYVHVNSRKTNQDWIFSHLLLLLPKFSIPTIKGVLKLGSFLWIGLELFILAFLLGLLGFSNDLNTSVCFGKLFGGHGQRHPMFHVCNEIVYFGSCIFGFLFFYKL